MALVVFLGGPCAQGAASQTADVAVSSQRVEEEERAQMLMHYCNLVTKKVVIGGVF